MATHNQLGHWGEAKAAEYLESRGYVIRDLDWRYGKRDLDIVAATEDGAWLVFVEVKTRESDDWQNPEEAVDEKKMRNLGVAANAYVRGLTGRFQVRFDIISIVGTERRVERVEHIEDAFNPLLL